MEIDGLPKSGADGHSPRIPLGENPINEQPDEGLQTAQQVASQAVMSETVQAATESGDDDSDYDLVSPEDMAEAFLQEAADIFAEGQRQWRTVRKLQGIFLQEDSPSLTDILKHSGFNRTERRKTSLRRMVDGGWHGMISRTQQDATEYYRETAVPHFAKAHRGDEEGQRGCIDHVLNEHPPYPRPEDATARETEAIDTINGLYGAVLRALHNDDMAERRLEDFLATAEPAVVGALIERIESLCEDEYQGYNEFPGLLEALAINTRRVGAKGFIARAAKIAAPPKEDLAADFIAAVIDNCEAGKRTDLTLKFMVFAAKAALEVEADAAVEAWRDDVAGRFARQLDQWPPELVKELSMYAMQRQNKQVRNLGDMLEQYFHPGRANGMRLVTDGAKKQARAVNPAKSDKAVKPVRPAPAAEELELPAERVKRIEQFSIFKTMVLSGGVRNRMVTVEYESVDELIENKLIADYIRKHQGDPQLASSLRQALNHLTTSPFDRTSTRRLGGVAYEIDTGERLQSRRLRRLSLQHLPGIKKGSISSKTRILYDILENNGTPEPAVYGVFHKQDIERMTGLPPR